MAHENNKLVNSGDKDYYLHHTNVYTEQTLDY